MCFFLQIGIGKQKGFGIEVKHHNMHSLTSHVINAAQVNGLQVVKLLILNTCL